MPVSSLARNGNLVSLLISDAILVSAMPMLVILGGLSGLMLAPTTALATLPASLQTLAWLLAAAPFSLLMGKIGRKPGFIRGAGGDNIGRAFGNLGVGFRQLCPDLCGAFGSWDRIDVTPVLSLCRR